MHVRMVGDLLRLPGEPMVERVEDAIGSLVAAYLFKEVK